MRSEAFCRPDVFSVFSTVRHFLLNQLTWRNEDLVNLSKLMLQLRPTVERSGSLVPASYHRKPAILDKSLPLIREYSSGSFAAEKRIQASASAWSRASFPGQRSVTEAHPRRLAGADPTNSSRIYFPCSADNTFKSSLSSLLLPPQDPAEQRKGSAAKYEMLSCREQFSCKNMFVAELIRTVQQPQCLFTYFPENIYIFWSNGKLSCLK